MASDELETSDATGLCNASCATIRSETVWAPPTDSVLEQIGTLLLFDAPTVPRIYNCLVSIFANRINVLFEFAFIISHYQRDVSYE